MSLMRYVSDLRSLVERRIEEWLESSGIRVVYVMFSGGKDSSAVLAAATSCCPDRVVAVYNHVVGQTHAVNASTALEVARRLGLKPRFLAPRRPSDLVVELAARPPRPGQLLYIFARSYRYGLDYWSAIRLWGIPAPVERGGKGIRWCCSEFKEKWWRLLPRNCRYNGRPAVCSVSGAKRSDSAYRRRMLKSPLLVSGAHVSLNPLYDLDDDDVWYLLRVYGLHGIVRRQYDEMGQAPNCVLCPLSPVHVLRKTVSRLPTPFLEKALAAIKEAGGRGSSSSRIATVLERVLEEEVARRKTEATTHT